MQRLTRPEGQCVHGKTRCKQLAGGLPLLHLKQQPGCRVKRAESCCWRRPIACPATADSTGPSEQAAPQISEGAAKEVSSQGQGLQQAGTPPGLFAFLLETVKVLRERLLEVLLVYGVKDILAFGLHRLTQRLTNHVAELVTSARIADMPNAWFLYLDANFIQSNPGYEVVVGVFFLLVLPLNLLLNSAAFALSTYLVQQPPAHLSVAKQETPKAPVPTKALKELGITASMDEYDVNLTGPSISDTEEQDASKQAQNASPTGLIQSLKLACANIKRTWPVMMGALRRAWWADIHMNMRALPLQALSLLVLPAFWTLPRLMKIQLCLPVALLEGPSGADAVKRSQALMSVKGAVAAMAVPFVGLILANRAFEYVQAFALASIPPRWWHDVIEVPIALLLALGLIKTLVVRLQDLLPLAAYLAATQQQQAPAAAPAAAGPSSGDVTPTPDKS